MELLIGAGLGLAIGLAGTVVGLDRDRSFYPTVLIVIAFYYVLFAFLAPAAEPAWVETAIATGFLVLSVAGFRLSPWLIVAGLFGHGLLDLVHHRIVDNPGVPAWWPGFCGSIDLVLGVFLATLLWRRAGAAR